MSDLEKLSPERLAEIAARVEAATPGPWHDCDDPWNGKPLLYAGERAHMYENQVVGMTDYGRPGTERGYIASYVDVTFIAASRTDVPALLAHIAAVEAERDALAAKIGRVEAEAVAHDGLAELSQSDNAATAHRLAARGIRAALTPPADDRECSCYESWAGHQSTCDFAKRAALRDEEAT